MQIFVRFTDYSTLCTVDDIEPTTTVAEIKSRAAAKLQAAKGITVAPAQIRLKLISGKVVDEGVDGRSTASTHGLTAGQNLYATIDAPVQGNDSSEGSDDPQQELVGHLRVLSGHRKTFLFIGIGSFDNNPSKGLTRQQQCPAGLSSLCLKAGLSLRILLIDPTYGTRTNVQQIYDIDNAWTLKSFSESEGGSGTESGTDSEAPDPVRMYTGPHGAELWVYAVGLPPEEYALAQLLPSELATKPAGRTLAGVDLREVATGIVKGGGALVAGNFYSTAVAAYHVAGSKEILAQLGPPYYRG